MRNPKILIMILLSFPSCAYSVQSILTLTLINKSSYFLTLTNIDHVSEGSYFSMAPMYIGPNEQTTITGVITSNTALGGELHLQDNFQHENIFTILDYQLYHPGQPIVAMHNTRVTSSIESKTLSRDVDPRSLSYSAATVILFNKVS